MKAKLLLRVNHIIDEDENTTDYLELLLKGSIIREIILSTRVEDNIEKYKTLLTDYLNTLSIWKRELEGIECFIDVSVLQHIETNEKEKRELNLFLGSMVKEL